MKRPYYYILNEDHSVRATENLVEWSKFFSTPGSRTVKKEQIGEYLVSTVFLGTDHNWGWGEEPLLFETMIFKDDLNYQRRCTTWEQALEMHKEAVAFVKDI